MTNGNDEHGRGDGIDARRREFVRRFESLLRSPWDLTQALALHESLDRLAADADAAHDGELSEQAIALSVYLCSFMESGRRPDLAQRQHMLGLARALAGEAPAQLDNAPPEPPVLSLLMVTDDHDLVSDLSCRLVDAGIAILARGNAQDLSRRPPETAVDALLVDGPQLAELARIMRFASQPTDGGARPLVFALTRSGELSERMFALRAGADEVLTLLDSGSLAERLIASLQPGRIEPYRCLIVDDDRAQTTFCDVILRSHQVQTAICNDPFRALDEIARFHPEVVLLDLYMPGLDGIELAQRIRRMPGTEFLSIVFLTGETDPDTRFDVLAAGGDDYYAKPIQPRHLIAGVVSRARRARLLRQHFEASR